MRHFLYGLTLLPTLISAFSENAKDNVVLYWGQNSARNEKRLREYCKSDAADIYIISFLNNFGMGGSASLNLASCWNTFPGSNVLNCPDVGEDIKFCQKLGKKVILSLGGAIGNYGLQSPAEAESVANELWSMFGAGSSPTRPFGDAVVDGYDLDLENHRPANYDVLVKKLRDLFTQDQSRKYYIAAAPQCVFPDASSGRALETADIDYVFVQFYNNPPCAASGSGFNWKTWKNFVETKAPNKNMKIFVGLPGGTSAAGSGYVQPQDLAKIIEPIKNDPAFGGLMAWDASQAFSNVVEGKSYADWMKRSLRGAEAPAAPSSSSSSKSKPEPSKSSVPPQPESPKPSAPESKPSEPSKPSVPESAPEVPKPSAPMSKPSEPSKPSVPESDPESKPSGPSKPSVPSKPGPPKSSASGSKPEISKPSGPSKPAEPHPAEPVSPSIPSPNPEPPIPGASLSVPAPLSSAFSKNVTASTAERPSPSAAEPNQQGNPVQASSPRDPVMNVLPSSSALYPPMYPMKNSTAHISRSKDSPEPAASTPTEVLSTQTIVRTITKTLHLAKTTILEVETRTITQVVHVTPKPAIVDSPSSPEPQVHLDEPKNAIKEAPQARLAAPPSPETEEAPKAQPTVPSSAENGEAPKAQPAVLPPAESKENADFVRTVTITIDPRSSAAVCPAGPSTVTIYSTVTVHPEHGKATEEISTITVTRTTTVDRGALATPNVETSQSAAPSQRYEAKPQVYTITRTVTDTARGTVYTLVTTFTRTVRYTGPVSVRPTDAPSSIPFLYSSMNTTRASNFTLQASQSARNQTELHVSPRTV